MNSDSGSNNSPARVVDIIILAVVVMGCTAGIVYQLDKILTAIQHLAR